MRPPRTADCTGANISSFILLQGPGTYLHLLVVAKILNHSLCTFSPLCTSGHFPLPIDWPALRPWPVKFLTINQRRSPIKIMSPVLNHLSV